MSIIESPIDVRAFTNGKRELWDAERAGAGTDDFSRPSKNVPSNGYDLKILHVIRSIDPRGGGPMEGVRQFARSNLRHGLQTEVVCFDPPGAPYLQSNPFLVHNLGAAWLKYGYHPGLVPWLRANAGRFDAVIINGIWQYHSFGTWRALRNTRIPYFVFTHGMLDPWFKDQYPLKHLKKSCYWPWADYRVLRDARAVFFTTEEERLQARTSFSLYRCREVVIGYGTAAPGDDPGASREEFLRAWAHLRDKRIVLFIGRIQEKKGCDLLVQAFASVASRDARLHLVMAGPGDPALVSSLKALASQAGIADRITWTGMLQGALKWGALRCAEVMCLPSHQENFGITVAESLACGTPVVISNKVNIWREVQQEGAGWIAEDTLPGTRTNLERWLDCGAEHFRAMRALGRSCFERHFRIDQVSDRLLEVVHGLRRPLTCGAR